MHFAWFAIVLRGSAGDNGSSTALGMFWNILKTSCPCQNDSRFDDLSSVSHCLWHEPWSLIYKQGRTQRSQRFKSVQIWKPMTRQIQYNIYIYIILYILYIIYIIYILYIILYIIYIIYNIYIQKWLNHVEYSILFTWYFKDMFHIYVIIRYQFSGCPSSFSL